jgi:SPP1 family predicted phage head-tail adaptor
MSIVRAGQLDHVITIQRATTTVSDAGEPVEVWTDLITLRAQRVRLKVDELQKDWGTNTQAEMIFRVRWYGDLRTDDRVKHGDVLYDLKSIEPFGYRHEGLELRCVAQK